MSYWPIILGKAGILLFTIGLLIGFLIPRMRNPRMALSAHLTAAQTGPALIAIALFWPYLSVPAGWTAPLVNALVASSYVLTAGIFLAAANGASSALPIAGRGHTASPVQERLVSLMVGASSAIMAASCVAICLFALAGYSGASTS